MEQQTSVQQPKIGRIRAGWELTKSSWHVLRLDKELSLLPLVSMIMTLVLSIPLAALVLLTSTTTTYEGTDFVMTGTISEWAGWLALVGMYFLLTFVANFFSAAVIHGAAHRFQGGNPTLKTSLAGAWHKVGPLAFFSLMMAVVGLVLQAIEERVPFTGKIAVWLFDGAWNIANIFAIPVIVLSDAYVAPLEATKQSVRTIKQVWGEGIIVNLGIGIIGFATAFVYGAACVGAGVALSNIGISGSVAIGAFIFAVLGFVAILLIFSVLGGIAKAALYLYATTGKAPELFSVRALNAAVNKKPSLRNPLGR